MGRVRVDITMSLDGFVAGPRPRREAGLGDDGDRLHEWVVGLRRFEEIHGRDPGDTPATVDDEILSESFAGIGAVVMGRGMFSADAGPWGEQPFEGWWGDEPPFRVPVFVLTHHPREPLVKGATTFTFVTDGIESAIAQARAAAGDQDVHVAGGGSAVQQAIAAGLVDDMQIHVAPLLLRRGVRLFADDAYAAPIALEQTRVAHSPNVAHLRYNLQR